MRGNTNLTLNFELKSWGAQYSELEADTYKGSLSELVNQLLQEKKDAVTREAALKNDAEALGNVEGRDVTKASRDVKALPQGRMRNPKGKTR